MAAVDASWRHLPMHRAYEVG